MTTPAKYTCFRQRSKAVTPLPGPTSARPEARIAAVLSSASPAPSSLASSHATPGPVAERTVVDPMGHSATRTLVSPRYGRPLNLDLQTQNVPLRSRPALGCVYYSSATLVLL